jgi:hypothetical protein
MSNKKIVVFDLDETLGYFVELSVFLDCINKYLKSELKLPELTQDQFNYLLDLYPEFLRPNIISILNYLKHKKEDLCCNKLMIYTNNQGPKKWAKLIISYFENKLNTKLFDQIIAAFKINGKQIEICRTSHEKSHRDFIRCTKLPKTAKICFLDDCYYPEMYHKNVYYINVKPYLHDLPLNELLSRLHKSKLIDNIIKNASTNINTDTDTKIDIDSFNKTITDMFMEYNFEIINKNADDYYLDKSLSKKIMIHLQEFFNKSLSNGANKKTRKNTPRYKSKNKTKREY